MLNDLSLSFPANMTLRPDEPFKHDLLLKGPDILTMGDPKFVPEDVFAISQKDCN
jgi:hypothetical protein